MDRRTSIRNLSSGLSTGALALAAFGLTFVFAILYIG